MDKGVPLETQEASFILILELFPVNNERAGGVSPGFKKPRCRRTL
jgi:hypothetical protein